MTPTRHPRVRQPSARAGASAATVVPLKAEHQQEDSDRTAVVVKRAPAKRSPMWWWAAAAAVAFCAVIAFFCVADVEIPTSVPANVADATSAGDTTSTRASAVVDDATAFIEWFQAEGGRVSDKISIASFDGMGRGVVARAPVHQQDELLFVPMDLIICRETIWKHASRKLLAKYEKLRDIPTELLTAFLLLEQFKDTTSRWHPYLRILPQYPPTFEGVATPLFFNSSQDLHQLQDERAISAATLERRQAKTAFQRFRRLFKNVLPADSTVSSLLEKRYMWARFLINSRAFSIRGDRYLVPFGDVFNGKLQPNEKRKLSDGDGAHFLEYHRLEAGVGMDILADRTVINVDEQVFEDYGDNDNYIYFLYHGFIMEDTPFDCATVSLAAITDSLVAKRILNDYSHGDGDHRLVCVTREGVMRSLQDKQTVQLQASVMAMDDEYIDVLCSKRENFPLCMSYSTQAEQEELLAAAIKQQLENFDTSLDQDLKLLGDKFLTPSIRHAVKFRISRKQILMSALESFERSFKLRDARQVAHHEVEVAPQYLSVDEKMKRFSQWVDQHEFSINHLELKYVGPSMGFGAFATKPLDKGEVYLSVPTEVVMDASSAVRSPLIRDLLLEGRERNVRWTESHILLLHLLHEQFAPAHISRWRPYLDILQDHGRLASPLFYEPMGTELQLLDAAVPNDLSRLVSAYRSRVDDDFHFMKRNLAQLPDWVTSERFRWANAILDSRSIWWSNTRHLVPLLDMVNCVELSRDHAPHATRLAASGDAAVTQASWRFDRGDHVVENYAQPNYIYLMYHGFVLSENSHDCAHFHFKLDQARQMAPHDTGRKAVIALMEKMQLYSWSQDICVGGHKMESSLEQLLRVALIAESPQKAAQAEKRSPGEITSAHVQAARSEVIQRIAHLERAIADHNIDNNSGGLGAIYVYIDQQHRLMTTLLAHLDEFPNESKHRKG